MKTIFVSSTFVDMQYERDILQEQVLPIVNARARLYGDVVSFCDLRWGVNTLDMDTNESAAKLLDICLDTIDRCDPIMIIILGERYGWVPDPEMVKYAGDRKKMNLESYDMSVTALEIEYGAFVKKKNTLIYFRQVEDSSYAYREADPAHTKKIEDLKSRVYKFTGGKVKTYKVKFGKDGLLGGDNFAKMVAEDVCALLSERWKQYEGLSIIDRDVMLHQSAFSENALACNTQGGVTEKIINAVQSGRRVINLYGESGTGKSVALGKVFEMLSKSGYTVLPFSVGYTVNSTTAEGVLESIITWLEERRGCECEDAPQEEVSLYNKSINEVSLMDFYRAFFNKQSIKANRQKLEDYCLQSDSSGEKLVIIVDGIDKFHRDAATDVLCFIPANMGELENITIIFSSDASYGGGGIYGIQTEAYGEEQNRGVLLSLLNKNNRELDFSVEREILKKCSGQYPQYIRLIVKRLLMLNAADFAHMTDMKNISEYQKATVRACADTLEGLGMQIMEEACKRVSGSFMMEALKYISLTREGLTEGQITLLCKDSFNKLDFYHLLSYMDDNFIMRSDGRLDFKTSYMKRGVLKSISDPQAYAATLLKLLEEQFFTIEIYSKTPDYAVVQDIAWLYTNYASDKQLLSALKLFNKAAAQYRGDENMRSVTACLDVLIISLKENGVKLLEFADNMLKDACCNSKAYNIKDYIFVVNEVVTSLIHDNFNKDNGTFKRVLKNSLKFLDTLQGGSLTVEILKNKANIACRLYTESCEEPDEKTAVYCFNIVVNEYTEELQNVKGALYTDLLDAYDIVLTFCTDMTGNIPQDDEADFRYDLLEKSSEALKGIMEYLGDVLVACSDDIVNNSVYLERSLIIVVKGYNLCAETFYKLKDYQSAKGAYGVSLIYYAGMPQELLQNARCYNVALPEDIYNKLADINIKIATKESLYEALEDYEAARSAAIDKQYSDEFSYYDKLEDVYKQLCAQDSAALPARIQNLNLICSLQCEYIYQYGIAYKALAALTEINESNNQVNLVIKSARSALDTIVKISASVQQAMEDNPLETAFDTMAVTYDNGNIAAYINDGWYISCQFKKDVTLAYSLFDMLAEQYKKRGDTLKNMSLASLRKKFDKTIALINFEETEE